MNNSLIIKLFSSIAIFGLLLNIIMFNLDGIGRLNPTPPPGEFEQVSDPPARPVAVALQLQSLGIRPGDRVAVIGYAYDSFWARLARVRIVAEMPEQQAVKFYMGDDQLQEGVLNAFSSSGAKAIVAEYAPIYARLPGWHKVGSSSYYMYIFNE